MECKIKGHIVSEPRQWRSSGGQPNLSFWLCDEDSRDERSWFQTRYKVTASGYYADVMFTELNRGQFVQIEGTCELDKVPGKDGKPKPALCVFACRIVIVGDHRGIINDHDKSERADDE